MRASLIRHEGGAYHSDGLFGREIRLEAGWTGTDGNLTSGIMWLSLDEMTLGDFWTSDHTGQVVVTYYLLLIY